MLPATVSAPAAEPPASILAAYAAHRARSGRGNVPCHRAARVFVRRWPDVQDWAALPLRRRLAADHNTRPFITFLMVSRRLRPGWDYLVARKLSSFWRDLDGSALQPDLDRFMAAARELGFTERVASAVASQVIARLLIQTGRPLEELTEKDLADLVDACRARQASTGRGWRHYRGALHTARQVLFHLEILDSPAPPAQVMLPFETRMAGAAGPLRAAFVAYLRRKGATCRPKTVSAIATRLAHFGRFLAETDPGLASLAQLDRCQHIEPYLAALTAAVNSATGEPITVADRARRVSAVACFLAEITEWGWPDAPARRLLFRSDMPRLPRPLPRYLPVDADRRLTEALAASSYRLAADALLLQRACGLRIGELLDLELDCVHEVPGQGSWLKVPLGKLETERMVPLDEETLVLIDRIAATRSAGRPIPHPRTGRPAQFLFTHHGKRLSQNALRAELGRAAEAAGLGHVTPHQLRHILSALLSCRAHSSRIAYLMACSSPLPSPRCRCSGDPGQPFTSFERPWPARREERNTASPPARTAVSTRTRNATPTPPHTVSAERRHSYATALVNAGVSLQALMALLGHVSAAMSLRYARLFDATVRTEYERALELAKSQIGPLPAGRPSLPIADITGGRDWKDAPVIKARLAGGYCLRAPAQGACPYANICEHCPSFRAGAADLPVLAAQRIDAEALATDAEKRGWIAEADRHQRLLARLDALIAQAQAG